MRKMKLKKKKNIKVILIPILICFIIIAINIFCKNIKLNNNEKFIKKLLQNSNYYFIDDEETNFITNFTSFFNINLKEPISIIDKVFAYEKDETTQAFAYIQNNFVTNPKVYIYSTHPNEKYLGEKLNDYELDNTVVLASVILQEKLNALGIETLVEEASVTKYLKDNNLTFNDSYQATRKFLNDKLNDYDFDLIIDLHRDSVSKETTVTIDEKNYAQIMFVQNVNYKSNVELANELNNILNTKYPSISRGIYNKYVDNFNQDLDEKVLLIELGSDNNTIEEVINSIDALTYSIKEILK